MAANNRHLLVRAMALAAKKQSSDDKTPIQVLEDIVVGKFTSEFSDGRTLISSSEAGGQTTFQIMGDLTPADVVSLAMETIAAIKGGEFGDEEELENVHATRRIKRLRVSFAKAQV